MGNLHQHTCSVTSFQIPAYRAAMLQITENLDTLFNNIVRLLAVNSDNESDAACVMLEGGIVEATGLHHTVLLNRMLNI